MSKSIGSRRLVAVCLVIAGLVSLPAPSALATGGEEQSSSSSAQGDQTGLLERVIEWLLDATTEDSDPNDGESGGGYDPSG